MLDACEAAAGGHNAAQVLCGLQVLEAVCVACWERVCVGVRCPLVPTTTATVNVSHRALQANRTFVERIVGIATGDAPEGSSALRDTAIHVQDVLRLFG